MIAYVIIIGYKENKSIGYGGMIKPNVRGKTLPPPKNPTVEDTRTNVRRIFSSLLILFFRICLPRIIVPSIVVKKKYIANNKYQSPATGAKSKDQSPPFSNLCTGVFKRREEKERNMKNIDNGIIP
jgi:hypothetical protein